MKRLLLISYYWPPAGGGGVMRWLKMGKYIAETPGWELTVYCPKEANYLIQDPSLMAQVPPGIEFIQEPILEPNTLLMRLGFGRFLKDVAAGGVGKQKQKAGWKQKFLIWVRSNLFVPDARAFWIKPSIRRLSKELNKKPFDAIVSTGPPHSTHLIALGLSKRFSIPWIADFRDPWTFIDFFEDLSLTDSSRKKHFRLEKEVLDRASKVVTVSESWASRFREKTSTPVQVISNGYDPNDFQNIDEADRNRKLVFCHIGSLNKDRSAPVFWEALGEICKENKDFAKQVKVQIIGNVSADLMNLVEEQKLNEQVELIAHLPHQEVIQYLASASVSLLFINNTSNKGGVIPGKIFEYLAVKNPILCIGSTDGDSASIIKQAQAGEVYDFQDKKGIRAALLNLYKALNEGELSKKSGEGIEKYSRKNLANEYLSLLNSVI